MVVLTPPPPTLSADNLTLYYVVDELLTRSPILVFYGPSATATSSANSSRIQAHVFSPGGLQSYPRLTISPSSPLYAAINCLPREEQGDEICRGLAFSVYKYFAELPEAVRNVWEQQPTALGRQPSAPKLFSDAHAAILASRMTRVENLAEVVKTVRQALGEQSLSWLDLDVVLPPGSMKEIDTQGRDSLDQSDEDYARQRYGGYASIVKLFGEPAFLPTSRLRRAPSKPSGLNRNASFSRRQKENLRREMCELLDTEESYVSKLHDLLHSVAEEFRQKAQNKSPESASPSSQALEKLFPPSLDVILKTNSEFLEAMRAVLEETENAAIQDIESTAADGLPASGSKESKADVTGAAGLAECLLSWLPKFAECYADYIQAHSNFPQHLKTFMNETGSSFSKRVQETGEQRLMSMLIEPVQRLPRYNLYIDNIIKQLPARHSAIKLFLKARDTITEICSRDEAPLAPAKVIETLQQLSGSWPSTLAPSGRVITAADITLLNPPYKVDAQDSKAVHGTMLLFTDYIVFFQKRTKQSMSARTLLGQLDGSTISTVDPNGPKEYEFHQSMRLSDVVFSELHDGSMVQFINNPQGAERPAGPRRSGSLALERSLQVCYLTGAYENRANRLGEEIAKARVEARFSEAERESHKWEVRSTGTADIHMFTSLFEDAAGQHVEGRGPPAKVRVTVDALRGSKPVKAGQDGVDIVGNLTIQGEDFFKLEMSTVGEAGTKDHLTSKEFLAVLCKRLNNLLQSRSSIRNPVLAPLLLARNQQILQALNIITESDIIHPLGGSKEVPRAPSPVKLLSSFFGGSVPGSPTKHSRGALSLGDVPRIAPLSTSNSAMDFETQSVSSSMSRPKSIIDLKGAANESSGLDNTLSSYLLALNARKGNIVGRVLRSRSYSAEETAVNELYNSLLEDPLACQAAAQAPVDVLFAAFEKFIKIAWKVQHGSILAVETVTAVQSGGQDFGDNFRMHLMAMSTQNQLALRDIVMLLGSLLDGTSNDGDRGILTAAFAEVLAPEELRSPLDLIMLLDRFVGDFDSLFAAAGSQSGHGTPSKGSVNSENRSSRIITGVADVMAGFGQSAGLTSHHSSLRKKFGFATLHRKNSKLEDSEGSASVWRTLSKGRSNTTSFATADAMSTSLNRSRSQDERDHKFVSPKRPVSRDRPTVIGAFDSERRELSTIGENVASNGPPRKKRRSSLSDLLDLQNSPTPNKLDFQLSQSPRVASPTRAQSPTKTTGIPQRVPVGKAGTKKENAGPYSTLPRLAGPLSPTMSTTNLTRGSPNRPAGPRTVKSSDNANKAAEDASATSHVPSPTKRRTGSVTNAGSGIPSLRSPPPALHERPSVANIARFPPDAKSSLPSTPAGGSPTRKLRMQSPQKLRERLASDAKAIQDADAALAAEMAKIGEELNALGPRPGSSSSRPGTSSSTGSTTARHDHSLRGGALNDPKVRMLEARLKALEATIPTTISSLSKRITAIEADVSSSLSVSESKARGLDELLRDASAENEALYGRFNEELAKVARSIRAGGAEELKRQMEGMREEQEKLRKENARLRREVVGLRAQLRE